MQWFTVRTSAAARKIAHLEWGSVRESGTASGNPAPGPREGSDLVAANSGGAPNQESRSASPRRSAEESQDTIEVWDTFVGTDANGEFAMGTLDDGRTIVGDFGGGFMTDWEIFD